MPNSKYKASFDAANNLLAIIHRDGGQHTGKVGFIKSCLDAEIMVQELRLALMKADISLDDIKPKGNIMVDNKSKYICQLIKSDGTIQEIRKEKEFVLEDIQKLVGGYVELVELIPLKAVMLVDEDANIKKIKPPVNVKASKLAGRTILGDVVIIFLTDLKM